VLELLRHKPNWLGALSVALTRAPGAPERRRGEDPWTVGAKDRPRRATDDLAWLRSAFEEPEAHGLRPMPRRKAIAAWKPDDAGYERLVRLRDRHILEAAGFELRDIPVAVPVPVPARTAAPRFERQPAVARKARR
jgi:hypothetical protein